MSQTLSIELPGPKGLVPFQIFQLIYLGLVVDQSQKLTSNLRHYAGAFDAPEALDLSGPLSRMGFQDPVYVIRAKTLALIVMMGQYSDDP